MSKKFEEQLDILNKRIQQMVDLKKSYDYKKAEDEEEQPMEEAAMDMQNADEEEQPMEEAAMDMQNADEEEHSQDLKTFVDELPREQLEQLAQLIQEKLSQPTQEDMMKSYKKIDILEKRIEELTKSLQGRVVDSSKTVDPHQYQPVAKSRDYNNPPKMLSKSMLINSIKKDPNMRSVLMQAETLPEGDVNEMRRFYDMWEQKGVRLPTE